jgi:hypothetical protein
MFRRAIDLIPALERRLADGMEASDRVRRLLLESGPYFQTRAGDLDASGAAYARLLEAAARCGVDPETVIARRLQPASAGSLTPAHSLDALVVNHFDDFRSEAQRLPALVQAAQALSCSGEAPAPGEAPPRT